jgi:hypothetical protein
MKQGRLVKEAVASRISAAELEELYVSVSKSLSIV